MADIEFPFFKLEATKGVLKNTKRSHPVHDYLGELSFNDLPIYYFKGDKALEIKNIHAIYCTTICIPKTLSHIKVKVNKKGNVIIPSEKEVKRIPLGEDFHGIIAAAFVYKSKKDTPKEAKEKRLMVKTSSKGIFGCPRPLSAKDLKNARNLLFHNNKHYYYPFVVLNGNVVFYTFENEGLAEEIIKDLLRKETIDGAAWRMDAKAEFDNSHNMLLSRDINNKP